MGKEIGCSFKYNRSKTSTSTLKKPVSSSASNLERTSISSQLDNKYITTNQNKKNTSNIDDIHSCVIEQNINYSVHATSATASLTPFKATIPIVPVELHTTKKLPPAGKEYLCFQIHGRYSHAAQCVKLRITNKSIDYILSIDTFEQQYVVIKGMLQSPRL